MHRLIISGNLSYPILETHNGDRKSATTDAKVAKYWKN